MKTVITIIGLCFIFCGHVWAQTDQAAVFVGVKSAARTKAELDDFEPLALFTTNEITTTSGETLFYVKVMKVDPDGLVLKYKPAGGGLGIKKIPFGNLPEWLQRQFGYDPQRAAAYKDEQTKIKAAYEEEQAKFRAEEIRRQNAREEEQRKRDSEKTKTVCKILSNYHEAHTYVGTATGAGQDIFVCGDMACDVWDMVHTKGIEARIALGNVERDIHSWQEANHVWVLAEVAKGKWLALETTGGYVVYPEQNARYYHAYWFFNSKELRDEQMLVRMYNAAVATQRHTLANEIALQINAILLRNKSDKELN